MSGQLGVIGNGKSKGQGNTQRARREGAKIAKRAAVMAGLKFCPLSEARAGVEAGGFFGNCQQATAKAGQYAKNAKEDRKDREEERLYGRTDPVATYVLAQARVRGLSR